MYLQINQIYDEKKVQFMKFNVVSVYFIYLSFIIILAI